MGRRRRGPTAALVIVLALAALAPATSCGSASDDPGAGGTGSTSSDGSSDPVDSSTGVTESDGVPVTPVRNSRSYRGVGSDEAPTVQIATTQEELASLWKEHLDEDVAPQLPEGHTLVFVWSPRELLEVRGVTSGPDGAVVMAGSVVASDSGTCATIEPGATTPWVAVVDVGERLSGEVRLQVSPVERDC